MRPNPTIALQGGHYPDMPSPIESYGRVLTLKQLMQQGALQQEQLELAKANAQERQRGIEIGEKIRGVFSETPDLEQALPKIMGLDPQFGIAIQEKLNAEKSKLADVQKKQFDMMVQKSKRKAQFMSSAKDEASYQNAIKASIAEGLVSQEEAQQALAQPWSPELASMLEQQARMEMDFAARLESEYKANDEGRKAALHPAQLAKADSDALHAAQQASGTTPITPYQQAQLQRTGLPNTPTELAVMAADPNRTPQERANAEAALKRLSVFQLAGRPARAAGGGGGKGGANPEMVAAVLANPSLYDNLTPTAKTAIAPALAKAGFQFGKNLTSGEMKNLSNSRAAVASLVDLRKVLQENEQYIGPVAGLQAMLPYSDAKKAKAKIDLVRQRVGKSLEEGVLRKEDEEKYKHILATLTDTPELAISKIDGLISTMESDMKIYEDELKRGGRRVNSPKEEKKSDPLGIR